MVISLFDRIEYERYLTPICAKVIEAHPEQVKNYHTDATGTMRFLLGQVRRELGTVHILLVKSVLLKQLKLLSRSS